ncbi:phosphate acetyltransferase [Rhodopseudomonas palustris]|uniref:Phosphate acetyltransferase n=1 Tax=Rhodopseudomonas palustris (strain BisB18) TaxID=316056 RepID=Q21BM0_RHOPB
MTKIKHPRGLFVAPASSDFEVSAISLGLVDSLRARGLAVGYVKPIGDPGAMLNDRSSAFARRMFGLKTPEAIPAERAEQMIIAGRSATLLEEVVALVSELGDDLDIVVVEGAALADGHGLLAEFGFAVARNLSADVIPVISGRDSGAARIGGALIDAVHRAGGAESCAGAIVIRCPDGELAPLRDLSLPVRLLGVLPEDPGLAAPRLSDVVADLGFEVLHSGQLADARMRDVIVAARGPEHIVDLLRPGTLVVTPGDRHDVVITTALASTSGMPIAGLLLTCAAAPTDSLNAFLMPRFGGLTVLKTELQTFEAAMKLGEFDRGVRSDDARRMERLIAHASENLDLSLMSTASKRSSGEAMPPPVFRHKLIRAARAAARRIVLPEGDEPRTLAAAADCTRRGIAHCVLLGECSEVRNVAARYGVDLPGDIEILDPASLRASYVEPMVRLRKSKGLTPEEALSQLEDNVVLATMMLAEGHVDGLVSGAVHTTASTVRPALQLIKTAAGSSLVSSVFFMLMPDQVLVYGDCAVNPDPTAEQLAEIAVQSADSAAAFGIEPRVAMISYSTGESGTGGDVDKVRAATEIVRKLRPELAVDGPIQYDAATVESVGRQKAPGSPVAGRANVFVFPDLNTGNTTYKAVQRSADVISIGPMLQGLRKPVNDLSRGALVDDIIYTIAITAMQAAQAK